MNWIHRSYEEKRNFVRMQVDTPITIVSDTTTGEITGQCLNLSGGGLMVAVDTALPVGAAVNVCIASSYGHNPTLSAKAEVTRVGVKSDSKAKPCILGMEIVEML